MTLSIMQNIELLVHRCSDCGRFWGVERHWRSAECPFCSIAEVNRAKKLADKFERSNRGLRGAIARMRKGKP